jgi:hypothetical protein
MVVPEGNHDLCTEQPDSCAAAIREFMAGPTGHSIAAVIAVGGRTIHEVFRPVGPGTYGSGQITWPEILWIVIRKIEEAGFLTAEHERDIFSYDEARFLHRSETEISRVHER